MKKVLLSIGTLLVVVPFLRVSAQTTGIYVANGATMQIGKGVLLYNGGSMSIQSSNAIVNHGNVMVVGTSSDKFETKDATSFTNVLNEPAGYADAPPADASVTPSFTYGQLYISGIPQGSITGKVGQELRYIKQDGYQQIGIPFFGKQLSDLSTEFDKTFNAIRYSRNEILKWDNRNVLSDNVNITTPTGVEDQGNYYMLGTGNGILDLASATHAVHGIPYSDQNGNNSLILQDAGAGIDFGTNGGNSNKFTERYNTYLSDGSQLAIDGVAWGPNYGRNLYQFSNPYLTNLDLSSIRSTIPNLYAVSVTVGNAVDVAGGGTYIPASSQKKVTWDKNGQPAGDVQFLSIRPFGTFVLKLLNNDAGSTIDFGDLRRFAYYSTTNGGNPVTGGNPTVASIYKENLEPKIKSKESSTARRTGDTVKQLAVIGVDAKGNEIARSYYVVSANAVTGFSSDISMETTGGNNTFGTFEESKNGGYDYDHVNYMLYINEANEHDFLGKDLMLVNYNPLIQSVKFEIKENGILIPAGQDVLSSGQSFYYKDSDDAVHLITQDGSAAFKGIINGSQLQLYYGYPEEKSLGLDESAMVNKTKVVFSPVLKQYLIRFSKNWKNATVSIYDLSGRLVQYKRNVTTSQDYVIDLRRNQPTGYVVMAVSERGETVTSKIIVK